MKKKIIWLVLSCLIVAALVLASCKAAPAEKKETGGTISTYNEYFPITWDHEDINANTAFFSSFLYDTMVAADWWKAQEVGAPLTSRYESIVRQDLWTGQLAESWEWSDPLKMTLKIRKGVKWQNKPPANGREFTADDVLFQFNRMLENPKRATQILVTNMKSITAPDKYTVVFEFKEPNVLMLYEVAYSVYYECPDVVKTYGDTRDWTKLVGTGPWMLIDYVPDSSLTYQKNPDYFLKDPDGNQLPYCDYAKEFIIKDLATQIAALRTAKVDKTQVYNPVPWSEKESLEQTNPDMQFVKSPAGGLFNLYFRTIKAPFNDVRVRRALSMVINRQELVDTLLDGSGSAFAWPAADFWPCYTPVDKLPAEIREIYEYKPANIDKAKQLLADAGYPNGFETSCQYNITPAIAAWGPGMELLKTYWAKINVDLELIPVDAGTASALRQIPFPYDDILGVGGGQESPEKVVEGKFRTGAPWNRALISDPYVDEMFDNGMKEFDFAKRNAIWTELYQYLAGACFDFTFPRIDDYQAWHPWVKGYNGQAEIANKSEGHVMARIWLDLDLKEEMTGKR